MTRTHAPRLTLRRGTKVISHKVGTRNSFRGKIVFIITAPQVTFYHVADKHGMLWHRTRQELSRYPTR